MPAAMWNGLAGREWNWLITEVRRMLRVLYPEAVLDEGPVQYFRVNEPQERELLHLHVLLRHTGVTVDQITALFDLAVRHVHEHRGFVFGWGHKWKLEGLRAPGLAEAWAAYEAAPDFETAAELGRIVERAVWKPINYLAKYVTKGGKRLRTVHPDTGEIRELGYGYCRHSSSGRWGLTLRQITEEQRAYCAALAVSPKAPLGAVGLPLGAEGALETNWILYGTWAPSTAFEAVEGI
jgi:hypothetical protein